MGGLSNALIQVTIEESAMRLPASGDLFPNPMLGPLSAKVLRYGPGTKLTRHHHARGSSMDSR